MKIIINKQEADAIWMALEYYVYQATHDPDRCAGLPEGEEKQLITNVMNKLLKETRKRLEKK